MNYPSFRATIGSAIIAAPLVGALFVFSFYQIAHATNTNSIDLESGSSQSLSASDSGSLSVTGDFTLEMWVEFESDTGDPVLYSKYETAGNQRSFFIQKLSSGSIHMNASSDGSTATAGSNVTWSPSMGTWYHLAVVYDASAGSAEIFVDGSSIGTSTGLPNSIFDGTAAIYIGKYGVAGGQGNYFDGLIDDVRLWNVTRTGTEISNDRYSELNGSESGLVAYWQLNASGNDSTSSGNTLTLNGGPVYSADLPFTNYRKARKSADESVTSSTTLQDDNDLVVDLAANTTYIIDGVVLAKSASADPDVKLAFTIPSGATMDLTYIAASNGKVGASGALLETSGTASEEIALEPNRAVPIHIMGTVKTSSTAGSLQLQWAQNTSDGTAATVLEGSYLRAEEI